MHPDGGGGQSSFIRKKQGLGSLSVPLYLRELKQYVGEGHGDGECKQRLQLFSTSVVYFLLAPPFDRDS